MESYNEYAAAMLTTSCPTGVSEEAKALLTRIAIRDAYRPFDFNRALQITNVLQLQARRIIAGNY